MKKILIVCCLLSHCFMTIAQQYIRLSDGEISNSRQNTFPIQTVKYVDKGILVSYQFNYVSKYIDNLYPSSSVVLIDGFGITEQPESPAIPVKWDTFAVPSTDDYKLSIIDSSFIEIPMEIAPGRPPLGNSSNVIHTLENVKPVKPFSGLFPINLIKSQIDIYRKQPILNICLNPIQYDYNKKRVRLYSRLTYQISFSENSTDFQKNLSEKCINDPVLLNIISNPQENILEKTSLSTAVLLPSTRYLIITVPKYLTAVNKLADWKRTQGYDVKILSKTSWDETAIMDSINGNNPTQISYLLLFGDYEDVPGKSVSNYMNVDGHYNTYNFVSDYSYGCILGNSYPVIRRGRIPVSSATEAMNVVNKIIQYEMNPIKDASFYNTALNCAFFQDYNYENTEGTIIQYRDGYEDRRFTLTSEEIRDYLINSKGKNVNRIYFTHDSITPLYWSNEFGYSTTTPIPSSLLRSNGFLWDGNDTDIENGIESGAFCVLHRDHGTGFQWEAPYFDYMNVDRLTNGRKLPVVFSVNCLTGRYNIGYCFAEHFLRNPNGGCVAIFAASEISLSGYNDALALAMFNSIWPNPGFVKSIPNGNTILNLSSTPIYRLGDILDQGLSEISTIYPSAYGVYLKHTKEIFHCFGDPSMEIYTDVPTPFRDVNVTKSNNSITVDISEDASITFYNTLSGNIETYYGNHVNYPYNSNLRICISAHNKIPFVLYDGTLYIQDDNITNNRTYTADNIEIGSNVTSNKPTGDVIIVSGTTELHGNVTITGNTSVLTGGELYINN